MENRKITKAFFISEKRKAICTDEKIYICDEKDNIEKVFERKPGDLYKIKNSHLLALVEYHPIEPRIRGQRRNAITANHLMHRGKTTLIDSESLAVVNETPHPITNLLALENQWIGVYGQCLVSLGLLLI